ncbi:MAG: hypothetical protein ACE5JN_15140 [Candidatus Methylomirabilia bacterium]
MPPSDAANPLKVVLVIYAIVALVYGLGLFFVPGTLVTMADAQPVDFGWLRWPGGMLIALGIGALLVLRSPAKQGLFVMTIASGNLLSGLALLYSWLVQEYSGATWFIATPTVIVLVVSALLWWARYHAREIL